MPMNPISEIGSEFWIDPNVWAGSENTSLLFSSNKFPKNKCRIFYTSSGRGAIDLLLKNITPENKSALIPEYTCEAVITPFINAGYAIHFFEIESNLEISTDKWWAKYWSTSPGVVVLHPYFGFDTISKIRDHYEKIKSHGTIIVEDITHSMLSEFPSFAKANYYLGSIRKWTGVPDGGFLIDNSKNLKITPPIECDDFFVNLRAGAFEQKYKFIQGDNSIKKENYLSLFAEAENHLDQIFEPKSISQISLQIIKNTNWDFIRQRRRENYLFLEQNLQKFTCLLRPIFDSLPESVCPLFMPILVKNDRHTLKKWLVDHEIYTPIHWPLPKYITGEYLTPINKIYHQSLSIPCDQRYRQEDMIRIINVLDDYRVIS